MEDVIVSGASIDSRTMQNGDLFIPFRGEQVNGHNYVESAIEQGAVASFWMKDEPNPPKDIPLIFVEDPEIALQEMARAYRETLDIVKSLALQVQMVKHLRKISSQASCPLILMSEKTEGNFNNELGLPLTILVVR